MEANLSWLYYKKYYEDVEEDLKEASINSNNNDLLKSEFASDANKFSFDVGLKHSLYLQTLYPGLLIGSGYTHAMDGNNDAFKIGFYFDHVTGMPCIPGHSIKGVLRSVFPNHKNEKYKDAKIEAIIGYLKECKINSEEKWASYNGSDLPYTPENFVTTLGALVFEGKQNDKSLPMAKRDIFHDAYIYKATGTTFLGDDYITAHEHPLKEPNPVKFLKVLPEVTFKFQFQLVDNLISTDEKLALFKKVLLDFGVGAKTNVGYGQFTDVSNEIKSLNRVEKIESCKFEESPAKEIARIPFKKGGKNDFNARIIEENDIYYLFLVEKYGVKIMKSKDAIHYKAKKDAENRANRGQSQNYLPFEMCMDVTIRINDIKAGKVNFTVIPKWID